MMSNTMIGKECIKRNNKDAKIHTITSIISIRTSRVTFISLPLIRTVVTWTFLMRA